MRRVEFWLWIITDEVTHKRRKTRYRMPEAEALAQYPDAERVPGSLEVRELPETDEEHLRNATAHLQGDPRCQ